MQTRVAMRLAERTLKRALPAMATASATSTQYTARSGAHLIVTQQRLMERSVGEHANTNSNSHFAVHTAIGGTALMLALAGDDVTSPAQCEALDDDASKTRYFDDDYDATQLVGSGTFGMVMQCVSKKDGHVAAVKMIQDLHDIREEVAREMEALSTIQQVGGHDNIVRFDRSYEHDGFHYIVTEFVEGQSLHAYIEKHRQLDVKAAMQLTAQLASALSFLRSHQLIHRDLKPENVMVSSGETSSSLRAKIIDFGSAELFSEPSSSSTKPPRAMALSGTRCYWPPEVLLRQETSPAMDMWALGCMLYIMIAGRHPFDIMGSSSEDDIVQRATKDKVSFLHPVWCSVPASVKDLIRGLLEKDPAVRLSVDEVLVHPAMSVVQ